MPYKGHVHLVQRLVTLLSIALLTAANQIFPRGLATKTLWYQVVDGEVLRLVATVLACVIVACQYASSRQSQLRHRALHMITKLYHGWRIDGAVQCVNSAMVRVQDFGFSKIDKRNGPP